MNLSKNLRNLLNEKNLSVSALARETGVPKTNIQQWLNGSSPNIEQLNMVASYFAVSIDYLAFNKEDQDVVSQIFSKLEVHTGLYEISVKKMQRKA
jgi:transcriptional regulator with XRE-family HTH domain